MNYKEALKHVDDYLDDLLDEETRVAFESILADSESLQSEVEGLRRLKNEARTLPKHLEPERDLWAGIANQIQQPEQTVSFSAFRSKRPRLRMVSYALAAAALLVIVLGVGVMSNVQEPLEPVAVQPVPAHPVLSPIEQEYATARTELQLALDGRKAQISPEMLVTIEENLAVIEDAVVNINRALEDNPSDPGLERMLHAAFQSEMNLLQQAVSMADQG